MFYTYTIFMPDICFIFPFKDIKELQLTENASFKKGKAEKGDGYIDHAVGQYICPVTGLEMSGTFK